MLDDECRLGQASDEKFAARMYKAYETNPRFIASAPQKRDHQFCVRHYAGAVVYSSVTFVEKNKDEVPKESTALLQSSAVQLLKSLFTDNTAAAAEAAEAQAGSQRIGAGVTQTANRFKSANASSNMRTVGTQFKEQLHALMDSIYATTPHYIRCLKPNDQNVSDNFNRVRITEQLRYGGVLEAVRVARSGFPVRLSHAEFYARYRALANPYSPAAKGLPMYRSKEPIATEQLKAYCDQLITALWDAQFPADGRSASGKRMKLSDIATWYGNRVTIAQQSLQVGLTKVFLRKNAHDVLEGRRSRRILIAARRLQSQVRSQQERRRYQRLQVALRLVQRVVRGMLARIRTHKIRTNLAATKIQRQFRRFFHQSRFTMYVHAVTIMQAYLRARRARKLVAAVRMSMRTLKLQKVLRGLIARHRFVRFRHAVVVLQSRMRKGQSTKQLKVLRKSAKDLGKLRQSNEELKTEITSLKVKAAEEREKMRVEMEKTLSQKATLAKVDELNMLRTELENAYKLLEVERALHQQAVARCVAAESKLRMVQEGSDATAGAKEASDDNKENELRRARRALRTRSAKNTAVLERRMSEGDDPMAALARMQLSEPSNCTSPYSDCVTPATAHVKTPAPGRRATTNANFPTTLPSALPVRSYSRGVSSGNAVSSTNADGIASNHGSPYRASPRPVSSTEWRRWCLPPALEQALRDVLAKDATSINDPGHVAMREALECERIAREALEQEVSRLRHIGLDYKAQIDSLRKNGGANSAFGAESSFSQKGSARNSLAHTHDGVPTPIKRAANVEAWRIAWEEDNSSAGVDSGNSRDTNSPARVAAMGRVAAAKAMLTSRKEVVTAVSTFEKNMEDFKRKLRQVRVCACIFFICCVPCYVG
jgi:hypothetical protein